MAQREPTTRGELEAAHTPEAIEARMRAGGSGPLHHDLGDFVLGAVDGAVTTFAIVAGAAGAGMPTSVALVLGTANVLADAFSMAASNFLKARSDHQVVERIRRLEEWHVEQVPEGEREEIRQIFAGKGFDGDLLEQVVHVITRDRKRWVDTMLQEEWGLQLESPCPWRSATTTFLAFLLAGSVPLIPLLGASVLATEHAFLASVCLTAATFFVIGWFRGMVTRQPKWLTALETLAIGTIAAVLAYLAGHWLDKWILAS